MVDFSKDQFPVKGRILAFNSGSPEKPGLLLHIYGPSPAKTTIVLRFEISRPKQGEFGTVFSARIPEIASDLGYVTDISLKFDRQYRYRGRRAASSAPAARRRPDSAVGPSPSRRAGSTSTTGSASAPP